MKQKNILNVRRYIGSSDLETEVTYTDGDGIGKEVIRSLSYPEIISILQRRADAGVHAPITLEEFKELLKERPLLETNVDPKILPFMTATSSVGQDEKFYIQLRGAGGEAGEQVPTDLDFTALEWLKDKLAEYEESLRDAQALLNQDIAETSVQVGYLSERKTNQQAALAATLFLLTDEGAAITPEHIARLNEEYNNGMGMFADYPYPDGKTPAQKVESDRHAKPDVRVT